MWEGSDQQGALWELATTRGDCRVTGVASFSLSLTP